MASGKAAVPRLAAIQIRVGDVRRSRVRQSVRSAMRGTRTYSGCTLMHPVAAVCKSAQKSTQIGGSSRAKLCLNTATS